MAEKKFYGIKNDYMFKALLQSSERVLRNLVATLLGIDELEITSCKIENSIELGASVDAKDCVLDVKLVLNDTEIINLEIQVQNERNWPERSLLYWARSYDTIKEGEDYSVLKKTYHIGILDFTLFKDNPSFYAEYKLMDTESGYVYSDKMTIKILDLTRVDEVDIDESNITLVRWAKMFKAKTLGELEALAGDEEVLKMVASHIKELSEDEKIRYQCQAREKYECRLTSQYNRGEKDGITSILIALVKDGEITIESAARRLGVTDEEFRKLL